MQAQQGVRKNSVRFASCCDQRLGRIGCSRLANRMGADALDGNQRDRSNLPRIAILAVSVRCSQLSPMPRALLFLFGSSRFGEFVNQTLPRCLVFRFGLCLPRRVPREGRQYQPTKQEVFVDLRKSNPTGVSRRLDNLFARWGAGSLKTKCRAFHPGRLERISRPIAFHFVASRTERNEYCFLS
jgi:hypothetical protein